MNIDFYWDPSSTNTYFAWRLLRPIAQRYQSQITMHSFNLGHVFRHHNYALTDEPVAKMRNRKRDLMRWAARYDLPFQVPQQFPIKTSRVLRAAIAMRNWSLEHQLIEEVLTRYWEQGDASIAEDHTLIEIGTELGAQRAALTDLLQSSTCRETVISETEAGLARGVFGAPTFVIDHEIYWGKDRMSFIEQHLKDGAPCLTDRPRD